MATPCSGQFGLGRSQFITKTSLRPVRDFPPIARMFESVNYMIVNVTFPAKTLAEFIRYGQGQPAG